MSRSIHIIVVLSLVVGMLFIGCKKDEPTPEPQEQETIKTMEEYRQDADKEITEANASDVLAKLEEDVDSEPVEP